MQKGCLSVGAEGSDVRGFTNVHVQCAVDRLAFLGGGEVRLSEGIFTMADALHLRSGITVRGRGETTVLRKNALKSARLATVLGFGHYDIELDDPERFEIGEGILIRDDRAHGFYATVGTLVAREGATWFTNRPHNHDYSNQHNGLVATLFPVISAYDIVEAGVEDLAIDGNADENAIAINGCRGGGVFLMRTHRTRIARVRVRNYNGEGFSFQTCDDIKIVDCTAGACTGNGFHPGSGSNRFHIRGCRAERNTQCGLFYCLRVRQGLLEECVFEENGGPGISIGGRDTGNVNRRLTLRHNGGPGFAFRSGTRDIAAHQTTIEASVFDRNCRRNGEAELLLQGEADGVRILNNRIVRQPGKPGILIMPEMGDFIASGNTIKPPGADVIADRRQPSA